MACRPTWMVSVRGSVTGLGDSLAAAAERSRAGAAAVRFQGAFYRNDIGWRELARQS